MNTATQRSLRGSPGLAAYGASSYIGPDGLVRFDRPLNWSIAVFASDKFLVGLGPWVLPLSVSLFFCTLVLE